MHVIPENEISAHIVDAAIAMHRILGPGLLESLYERVLSKELEHRGLKVESQKMIPIRYRDWHFPDAFRADLLIGGLVIVEVKSVERIAEVHRKQTMSYLRLSGIRLGILINFNEKLVKNGIVRVANGLPDEPVTGKTGETGETGEMERDC